MDSNLSHWKTIIGSRPFRLVWLAVLFVLIVGAVGAFFLPIMLLVAEVVLLLGAIVLVFFAMFGATDAKTVNLPEGGELEGILSAIDDALILYDENFTVLSFNASAEKLFKIQAQDIVGHRITPRDIEREDWRILTQVVFPSLAPQVVAQSPEGKYPSVVEVSFTDPELEFRVTTAPIMGTGGTTRAFIKLVRDLTPEMSATRAKEDFIAVASHQLRGPVTDISWALESLAGATELGETNKAIVLNAVAASKGLLRRIEDFLDLSRIEGSKMKYEFVPTDIEAFLESTLADVMPAARSAGIKLYLDKPSEVLPAVLLDPKRLAIVLVNIIENAIRYNIENGEVIVKVEPVPQKPFIEISVKDTGIGIPADALPKLFGKFYRADNAVKSETEGSGIGLYIARGIVRAHGGDIWAESELGRGTTVRFTLPTDPALMPTHEVSAEISL
jgi:two-component system sensor histidine kinase VicK